MKETFDDARKCHPKPMAVI